MIVLRISHLLWYSRQFIVEPVALSV